MSYLANMETRFHISCISSSDVFRDLSIADQNTPSGSENVNESLFVVHVYISVAFCVVYSEEHNIINESYFLPCSNHVS